MFRYKWNTPYITTHYSVPLSLYPQGNNQIMQYSALNSTYDDTFYFTCKGIIFGGISNSAKTTIRVEQSLYHWIMQF